MRIQDCRWKRPRAHQDRRRAGLRTAVASATLPALALLTAPLDAQITLGVRAGATQSTMRVTDNTGVVEESSAKYGAHAAVSLGYSLNDLLGLVMDVSYTQRGAELRILDYDALYDAIWGYDYVDVSLFGRASLGPAYLLAGPSMAFRVACFTKISVRASCEEVGAVFRDRDVLLIGGAGVALDLGSTALVAEGLYNLGLLNVDNEGVTTTRHRGIVARIGVDFRLW